GGIREPGENVAQSADRELDQDVLMARIVVMRHDRRRFAGRAILDGPDLDPKANVPALRGVDEGAFVLAFEQDIAGVEVTQTDPPLAVGALRKQHAAAKIEVE